MHTTLLRVTRVPGRKCVQILNSPFSFSSITSHLKSCSLPSPTLPCPNHHPFSTTSWHAVGVLHLICTGGVWKGYSNTFVRWQSEKQEQTVLKLASLLKATELLTSADKQLRAGSSLSCTNDTNGPWQLVTCCFLLWIIEWIRSKKQNRKKTIKIVEGERTKLWWSPCSKTFASATRVSHPEPAY